MMSPCDGKTGLKWTILEFEVCELDSEEESEDALLSQIDATGVLLLQTKRESSLSVT